MVMPTRSTAMRIAVVVALLGLGAVSWASAQEQPAPPETAAPAADAQSATASPPPDAAVAASSEEPSADSGATAESVAKVQRHVDFVWTLVAAFLVFFMQAGFAFVETGLTRAKNAVNICMKNLMDFAIGSLAYWLIGFGLMFGASATGWFGTTGFLFSDFAAEGDPWVYAFWMFQVVFAATAATIVSGAMAERTKFSSYLLYSAFISAIVYPVFGSWAWGSLYKGGGWLEKMGFIDFAGSTVVHSVGGWAALAGAIVLGPRLGRYGKDGKPRAMPGHNLPYATLGVFILWFGWFGFNPGSTTAASTDIALIAVNTNLSAAAGAVAAMITAWIFLKKPDATMMLNGALAGLVGITAPCANVVPGSAVAIGLIAGVLVVFAVLFFDRIRIDDPVGAISVHGVCGAWGTLAAGLFNHDGVTFAIVKVQVIGIVAAFLWTFTTMFVFFKLIKMTIGLRVSAEEEIDGLDQHEHGNEAYAPDTYSSTAAGLPA
jgi:Amt family ammonium transporter